MAPSPPQREELNLDAYAAISKVRSRRRLPRTSGLQGMLVETLQGPLNETPQLGAFLAGGPSPSGRT